MNTEIAITKQAEIAIEGQLIVNGKVFRLDAKAIRESNPPFKWPMLSVVNLAKGEPNALLIDDAFWVETTDNSQPDHKIPFDDSIAFYAFRYCLGRKSYAVSVMVDYLIYHADKIENHHQKLMIEEIDKAIADGHAGWQMDIEQWERVRARFSPTVTVHVHYEGKDSTHTCYPLNGRYYTDNIRNFIAPEYITSVEGPAKEDE